MHAISGNEYISPEGALVWVINLDEIGKLKQNQEHNSMSCSPCTALLLGKMGFALAPEHQQREWCSLGVGTLEYYPHGSGLAFAGHQNTPREDPTCPRTGRRGSFRRRALFTSAVCPKIQKRAADNRHSLSHQAGV